MPLPLLPIALGGASFLGGLFGGGGPKLDPKYKQLQSILLPTIMNRLKSTPESIRTGAISDINRTYQNASTGLSNRLSARGLSTSPIAGNAEAHLQSRRAGDIVRVVPQIEEMYRQNAIQDAMQALQVGYGGASAGGSRLGGGISGLAQMLGFLYGSGAIGGGGGGPIPSRTGPQIFGLPGL